MSMRFNPPPGWPPLPAGWTPPPGWQPDPSWPAPPPNWTLWTEDAASKDLRLRPARWAIVGGATVFIGALLPFLSSTRPDLVQVNSNPKETAEFYGIVLAVLGVIMLARSRRASLISGILALVVAILGGLSMTGLVVAGRMGTDQTDFLGNTVHVNLSPQIGIILSILGCAVSGIGAIMSIWSHGKTTSRLPQTGAP